MPEKGAHLSQFVKRDRLARTAAEKYRKKEIENKKFINLKIQTKKFNGVVVGSDAVLPPSLQAKNMK